MREVTVLLQQQVPLSVFVTEGEFAEAVAVVDGLLKREIEIGVIKTSTSQIKLRADLFSGYTVRNLDADSVEALIARQTELKRIENRIARRLKRPHRRVSVTPGEKLLACRRTPPLTSPRCGSCADPHASLTVWSVERCPQPNQQHGR
jgi:hypothetical protein